MFQRPKLPYLSLAFFNKPLPRSFILPPTSVYSFSIVCQVTVNITWFELLLFFFSGVGSGSPTNGRVRPSSGFKASSHLRGVAPWFLGNSIDRRHIKKHLICTVFTCTGTWAQDTFHASFTWFLSDLLTIPKHRQTQKILQVWIWTPKGKSISQLSHTNFLVFQCFHKIYVYIIL